MTADLDLTDLLISLRPGRACVLWSVSRGGQLLGMGDAPDAAAAARDVGDLVASLIVGLSR